MARGKSKAALESELDEAKDYIEQLEGKLDDIAGIAADEDEDDEDYRIPAAKFFVQQGAAHRRTGRCQWRSTRP